MKNLLLGVLLLLLIGAGGFVYRNAVEHPGQPIACPLDAEICPDGTAVSRTGLSCTFPTCPPPNISLSSIRAAFALPDGFVSVALPDAASVAAYALATSSATSTADIVIRRYTLTASSTALEVIQQTAIDPTGTRAPVTAFSSTVLGTHRFTVVALGRSKGVIDTAYYLTRGTDVLRFDAIDTGVTNWTDPNLDLSTLPARAALRKLLITLQ